ncbi:MAG: VWA-like domain-containing protein, partial [Lachnospiraceae bacterium]|nr:VWA-like domain-containing protein [Lachnospiraceae bacterium]
TDENRIKEIKTLAGNVLELARDEILMSFRFLDRSLMELKTEMRPGIEGVSSSDSVMYYDPVYILKASQKDFRYPARILFHVLLHHIFAHPFTGERTDAVLWDLACDIAVESVIADLHEPCITLDADLGTAGMLRVLREDIGPLSAEKVYKYFRKNPLTPSRVLEYERAFKKDEHDLWHSSSEGEIVISEEEWKKIARQVLAEIRNFSEKGTAAESLERNLSEGAAVKYDYTRLLEHFVVMGENLHLSDDEFDYIYYTYGLEKYNGMPFIEPLEYRDEKRIRDFVIAIDTSASCSGETVRKFIRHTFDLLKKSESFFRKINVHIVQCDSEVKSDDRITDIGELDRFLEGMKLFGGGATDFRPVFSYVNELRENREFDDLRGMIYFTDGYGIYPEKKPDFDVIFAFLNEDPGRMSPPAWSMKAVIEEEELK